MSKQSNKPPVANQSPANWDIYDYEVWMYFQTRKLLLEHKGSSVQDRVLRNALVESAILHTRILVEILIDKFKLDDVTLSKYVPNWKKMEELQKAVNELKEVYGHSFNQSSPCGTINKMLAHPSGLRGASFDYSGTLSKLDPVVVKVIKLIGRGAEKIHEDRATFDENEVYTAYSTTTIVTNHFNEDDATDDHKEAP